MEVTPSKASVVEPGSVYKALNREPWDKYFSAQVPTYKQSKNMQSLTILPIKGKGVTPAQSPDDIAHSVKKENYQHPSKSFKCVVAEAFFSSVLWMVLLASIAGLWI